MDAVLIVNFYMCLRITYWSTSYLSSYFIYALALAKHRFPNLPFSVILTFFWNLSTAFSVARPYLPSTVRCSSSAQFKSFCTLLICG